MVIVVNECQESGGTTQAMRHDQICTAFTVVDSSLESPLLSSGKEAVSREDKQNSDLFPGS